MGRQRFRLHLLVVVAIPVIVGALLGGVMLLAWPPPALGADGCGVFANYQWDEASDGWHAGARSSQLTIENYAVSCVEVNSVILQAGAGMIEIGSTHDGPGVLRCEGEGTRSEPYLFVTWADSNGSSWCREASSESETAWAKEGFSLQDQDQYGNYTFAHNRHQFQLDTPLPTLAFSRGRVMTNNERHVSADSSWGHFESNFYMSVADGWVAWDTSYQCYLNDNDNAGTHFYQQLWSPSNITVSTGSQVCPS